MLSFLEVSGQGDVNVSYLPARPHVTAGVGGFNDIVTRAPKIVYSGYFTAGKKDIQIVDGQLDDRLRRHRRQVRPGGRARSPSRARWPASAARTFSTSPNAA